MKILTGSGFPLRERTAVAIGLFDGVHAGHMALIDDIKGASGVKSAVYTFDGKPAAGTLIYTHEEKKRIFESLGVDYYYEKKFSTKFMALSPEEFLKSLVEDFHPARLTVGFDFRFGKDAGGDVEFLFHHAEKYGYTLTVIPKIKLNGHKVSSRNIRKLIRKGDVAGAARLLERFYFVDGEVVSGRRLGNSIGFPTANITAKKLLPLDGVYAAIVETGGRLHRAVTNVGTNPTVKDDNVESIESYILDFDEDIYGSEIRVYFVEMLREEVRFGSVDALKAQIKKDGDAAAEILSDLNIYRKYIL